MRTEEDRTTFNKRSGHAWDAFGLRITKNAGRRGRRIVVVVVGLSHTCLLCWNRRTSKALARSVFSSTVCTTPRNSWPNCATTSTPERYVLQYCNGFLDTLSDAYTQQYPTLKTLHGLHQVSSPKLQPLIIVILFANIFLCLFSDHRRRPVLT